MYTNFHTLRLQHVRVIIRVHRCSISLSRVKFVAVYAVHLCALAIEPCEIRLVSLPATFVLITLCKRNRESILKVCVILHAVTLSTRG